MPRGKMSRAARAKIAAAQRKRWAAHRAAKDAGTLPVKKKVGRPAKSSTTATGARRGRPPKAASASGHNPFMNMTVQALAAAKRNIDEAWEMALAILNVSRGKPRFLSRRGGQKKRKLASAQL